MVAAAGSLDRLLAGANRRTLSLTDALALAPAVMQAQREALLLPLLLDHSVHQRNDASLWQWIGLLHRALDQRTAAIAAFRRARALAPGNGQIAHGLARVTLEAGLPAVALFDAALRLAPNDGGLMLGRAAALAACGQRPAALEFLDTTLGRHPLWLDGHADRIMLAWMMGQADDALAMLRRALQAHPRAVGLWALAIAKLADARDYDSVLSMIARARPLLADPSAFAVDYAGAMAEQACVAEADLAFASLGAADRPRAAVYRIRHALRQRRMDQAVVEVEAWLARPDRHGLWPYADIVWRLTGDPRAQWLHDDRHMLAVIDLSATLPPLEKLAATLRALHPAGQAPLDQSVRGGTQSDGALFSRTDPDIVALRAVLAGAVEQYIAQLPPTDPGHPLLSIARHRPPRFAGSWSVRLCGQGHHANHVHPAGVISSALYIALPEAGENDRGQAGWLALGCPQTELDLALPATRLVQPRVGQLVLFPSTMWHGTIPFDNGERLTVAFDIATPIA